MTQLSLVTGTRNRPVSFNRLVESIDRCALSDWELIAADASDTPIIYQHPRVRIIPEWPRMGCTKGYNRAFGYASGEWVLWLNDDAEVLPGFDMAAIDFMEQHPRIGLGALYYREMGTADRDFHVNSYFGMTYANFGIIERRFGDKIGWFDEDLEMYGNDNSIAFRTLLAGKGVMGIPDARVIHHCENDSERIANDVDVVRKRAVMILAHKYGSRMAEMTATYQAMGGTVTTKDQTPQWAWNEI